MAEIVNIKKAMERLLLNITPLVPTALEGVEFQPTNVMYQRCQFMIKNPVDPVFAAGYHREELEMQVFIADKKGSGTTAAITRAELIRNTFYKGLTLTESGTKIFILETAQIGSAFITQDRIIVPVLIPVIAEVYQ